MTLSQYMHDHLMTILNDPVISDRDVERYVSHLLKFASIKSAHADDNHLSLQGKFRGLYYVRAISARGYEEYHLAGFRFSEL